MNRGYYSAAAGALTQQKAFDVISNNIANVGTAGYKAQATVESSFADHLVSRISDRENSKRAIGHGSFITVNSEVCTDSSQGAIETTGRSVDMAILGEGFFLIESEKYGEVLTRNGQFQLDEDGDLYLPGAGKVLNDRGRAIDLRDTEFTVEADGSIRQGGRVTDTLYIASIEEEATLIDTGNDTYIVIGDYGRSDEDDYRVVQGSVERSNVNLTKEISKMIRGQGHFNSCMQTLRVYDSINEICVNSIGRVE